MAILIEEEKRSINWFALLVTIFIVCVLGFGTYYLFFAPTPAIEIILPATLQSANKVTGIAVDPFNVINSEAFKSLKGGGSQPSIGQTGRANPFLSF
jgi:hypothetical protein